MGSWGGDQQRARLLRFTNPVQQDLRVLFQAPNKAANVTYERILLCTADDYAWLQQLGVNWFSGDTYERDSGGGA